jgi:hypothetical protein
VCEYGAPGEIEALRVADGAQRRAEERSTLVWALQHPFAAGNTPQSLIETLVFRIRWRLGQRRARRARTVGAPVGTSEPEKTRIAGGVRVQAGQLHTP